MKKLLLLCSLFVGTSALVSCSSDDDSSSTPATPTSITLSSDVTTIDLGDSVNFSVMNDLDEDVTALSTYYSDGVALTSNVFTPTTSGTFNVHAQNGELVSNMITVNVNAVQEQNAVWFNESNHDLNTSAIVFWGGADPGETGTVTHAYWSVLTTDGTDIIAAANDPSSVANYVDIEFLTALDSEGNLVFPTTSNIENVMIYEMQLNGESVCDTETPQANNALTFGADITGEESSVAFIFYSEIDGTPADIDYDSVFEGIFDGSGGRPASEGGALVNKNALPLTLN